MLRCREVVDLVATERWREAPLRDRLALALHLAMCRHCRAYVRYLRWIGAVARRLYGPDLDAQRAQRLIAAVRGEADRERGSGLKP